MSNSPVQSARENARFQLRADLDFAEYEIGGDQQLVVKDPLKIEYYFFHSLERLAMRLLRTPHSIAQLKSKIDEHIAPAKIELDETKHFVSRLMRDNLVASEVTFDSAKKRQPLSARIAGLLAVRFRGINPQSLLDVLHPYTSWLFSPFSFLLASCLFLMALLAMVLNFRVIADNEYLWSAASQPSILIPLLLSTLAIKTLHELGHALACRSINRRCHEIGVMFLAFMPCLYCNVSDVWMESNRWRRMMVSSAGIFVEMLIAAACVPLFLYCRPGPLQVFLFSLILISSINTLFVNGNPLLKYDGYYIASDLFQLPNMYAAGRTSWLESVTGFFFHSGTNQASQTGLSLYGFASFIYRLIVMAVIVSMVYFFFTQWQLESLALLVATPIGAAIVWQMAMGIVTAARQQKSQSSSSKGGSIRKGRALGCLAVLGVLAIIFFFVPMKSRICGSGKIKVTGNAVLYAPHDGQIKWHAKPGTHVAANERIATISSADLAEQSLNLQHEIAETKLAIANQELLLRGGADSEAEIESLNQSLANSQKLNQLLLAETNSLNILSATGGTIRPLTEQATDSDQMLDRSPNSALASNDGCFVDRGEPLALIVNPNSFRAEIRIRDHEVNQLETGHRARLIVADSDSKVVTGTVRSIGLESTEDPNGKLKGDAKSATTKFVTVVIEFDDSTPILRFESEVDAIILGLPRTFFQSIVQDIRTNFRF